QGASWGHGVGPSLVGDSAHLRGSESALWRYCESHAEQQGGGRHDDVPDHAWHQAGGCAESRAGFDAISRICNRHAKWRLGTAAGRMAEEVAAHCPGQTKTPYWSARREPVRAQLQKEQG